MQYTVRISREPIGILNTADSTSVTLHNNRNVGGEYPRKKQIKIK